MLDDAALAGVGPVAVQDQPIFLVRIVVGESFTGRTDVDPPQPRSGSVVAKFLGSVTRDFSYTPRSILGSLNLVHAAPASGALGQAGDGGDQHCAEYKAYDTDHRKS